MPTLVKSDPYNIETKRYATIGKKWNRVRKISRVMPRKIIQDKEALYDNAIKIRRYANTLEEQNMLLKVKAYQSEEELAKKKKVINGLIAQMGNAKGVEKLQQLQKDVLS